MNDGDLVRQRKQKLHVVLDHDDGEVILELLDELQQPVAPVGAHPLGGLVQEQKARAGGQRHRDLQGAALAVRQAG
jgi:hypothetical protein